MAKKCKNGDKHWGGALNRGATDAAGRLFVDGRDDEMIVSGGENVFPREVEDCWLTASRSRRPR